MTKLRDRMGAIPLLSLAACCLAAGLAVWTLCTLVSGYFDSDTYFILATGRTILESGLPETNPFVIHTGLEMPIHQWLYDVVLAAVEGAAGPGGLFAAALILAGLLALCLWVFVRRFCRDWVAAAVLTALSLLLLCPWMNLRPTFLTLSVIALMQTAFFAWEQTRRRRYLLLPPALSLLLVNFHTSLWVMCLVLAAPHLMPAALPRRGELRSFFWRWWIAVRPAAVCVAAMAAAGLCNPYGLKGMLYPLLSYGAVTDFSIRELERPALLSVQGLGLTAQVLLYAFALQKKGLRGLDPRRAAMAAGTLFLAAMHLRNFWFTAFAAIPAAGEALDALAARLRAAPPKPFDVPSRDPRTERGRRLLRWEILAFFLVLVALTLPKWERADAADPAFAPAAAADLLDTLDREDIVLFTGFNNGAYMEYRGYRGYIDARPEIYTKKLNGTKDVLEEYKSVMDGTADYAEWLDRYGFTHLLVYETALKAYLRGREDFRILWEDTENGLILYERIGSAGKAG